MKGTWDALDCLIAAASVRVGECVLGVRRQTGARSAVPAVLGGIGSASKAGSCLSSPTDTGFFFLFLYREPEFAIIKQS